MLARIARCSTAISLACFAGMQAGAAAEVAGAPVPVFAPTAPASTGSPAQAVPTPDLGTLPAALKAIRPEGWTVGDVLVTGLWDNQPDVNLSPQTVSMLREFRCSGMCTKFFQRGQRLVFARVFRFLSPEGAYGAYSTLRQGASTSVARGDASSEDDQAISMWQGDYYLSVYTTAEDDDEAKALVSQIADQLVQKVVGHASVPALVSALPSLDRILGSERLVMGPVAARRVAPIPYIGSVGVENARGAVCADYHFRDPAPERLKLLVVDFGDPKAAQEAYSTYRGALADDEVTGSDTSTLFKTSSGFLLCQWQGSRMQIISGARKRYSPQLLARQLSGNK